MKRISILFVSTFMTIASFVNIVHSSVETLSEEEMRSIVGTNNGSKQNTTPGKNGAPPNLILSSCASKNTYKDAPAAWCSGSNASQDGNCIYCSNAGTQPSVDTNTPQSPGFVPARVQTCGGPVYAGTCLNGSCTNGSPAGNNQCSTDVAAYLMQAAPGGN